ncbi:SRPBCC domain-containing protein [Streptomyces somaliensis DSM 40738]|uniref:Carbon monoxide dehydrogenase n=1 Tax=Streptomyces somaliensis (strain ATCC 33201 / DSM 40738 / JCM 12659 / KCTC 9044 / NCTC 11332 / NRRL B-12077 / IP 733) TaxID=1134445 RepID=A0AA44DA84_STRE0|nr:SRPBCC domain-containing protein [Streptomyces somaliensis]MCQ0024565.1 SRPBCC domain-containing protein [Streptomyces somaliensis DSM 40738]NKY13033.1 carbon monoxide dehydrogenase [Streptomyces somaliensis DSM 40738]
MEHEVFVPVPVQSLRAVLTDPVRVARCVPGLQQDADASADPLAGRLKVRTGGQTVTYRGALRLAARDDGGYDVEGEGVEARGAGGVKVALTARLAPAEGGTGLAFTGTARAEGRLAELPGDTLATTARRLLDRFAEALAEEAHRAPDDGAAVNGTGAPREGAAPDEDPRAGGAEGGGTGDGTSGTGLPGAFDTPVPPSSPDLSSLDPFAAGDFPIDDVEPPVEAAHARRTMIGRSAEEVDHAPPRGRYAPVPGPDTATGAGVLRWLVPAAVLVLASVVVLGRALHRRKRSRRT